MTQGTDFGVGSLRSILALLGVLACGCSSTAPEPTLCYEDRQESLAIAALKGLPEEILTAQHCPLMTQVVQLSSGYWVGERFTFDKVMWDYRRTGSHALPIEAILAFDVGRWITKPCVTREEAESVSRSPGGMFLVPLGESYPRSYPPEASGSYVDDEFVVELVFDAWSGRWHTKSTEHSSRTAFFVTRGKWVERQRSLQSNAQNAPW